MNENSSYCHESFSFSVAQNKVSVALRLGRSCKLLFTLPMGDFQLI